MQDTFQWNEHFEEFLEQNRGEILTRQMAEQFKLSKSPRPEWEIVAYMETFTKSVVASPSCVEWSAAEKGHKNYVIHSVRRLSDGQVFSVGDRIKGFKNPVTRVNIGDRFVGGIGFECGENGEGCALFAADKLPAAILTTHDGKEIFEGDEFWIVEDFYIGEFCPFIAAPPDKRWAGKPTFSTKEAALDYVTNHRPVLSLNDVREARKPHCHSDDLLKALTALVKQKLNS